MKKLSIRTIALILLCLCFCACAKDPEEKRAAYLESAQGYLAEEKYAEAAIQFQNALQIAPDDVATLVTLGEIQLKRGKIKEAYSAFLRATNAAPDRVQAREYVASMLLLAKKYDKAREHAELILEQDAKNTKAREIVIHALFLSERQQEAVALMEKLLAEETPGESRLINAVQMYASVGRTDKALSLITRGASLYPQSTRVRFLASDLHARHDNMLEARRWAEEAYSVSNNDAGAGLSLARFYLAHNLGDLFTAQLQELKSTHPQETSVHLFEANVLFSRGDLDGALAAAQRARDIEDSTASRFQQAHILLRQDKSREAASLLEKTVTEDPAALGPKLLLASIALNDDNADRALELLNDPLKNMPNQPEVARIAALAYLRQGNVSQARRIAEDTLQAHSDHPGLLDLMSRIHFSQQKFPETLATLEKLPAPLAEDLLYRGTIAAIRTKDLDKARDYLRLLTPQAPDAWGTHHATILLALAEGNHAKAYRHAENTLQHFPDNPQAISFFAALAPQAIGITNTISRLDPLCTTETPLSCQLIFVRLLEQGGQQKEALARLKRIVSANGEDAAVYHALAAYYVRNQMTKDALREYEKIINQDPEDLHAATTLALLYQGEDQHEKAIRIYEYILKKNPQHGLAANNLAWLLAIGGRSNDLNRALQLASSAKDRYPEDPRIADTLGFVYLKKGLTENAIAQFSLSLEKLADDPEVHYHMALALLASERGQEAIVHLKKATAAQTDTAREAARLLAELQQ